MRAATARLGSALLLCLLPALAQAEPLIISQAAFVTVQALDLHSTDRALAHGHREWNAGMRAPWSRYLLKSAGTVAVLTATHRIARTRPRLARVILYAGAAGIGAVACRNYRIGGPL